ncbi:hypothetical protein QQS21_004922 [Conoideocrella luteorostrata]|uniref:BTB domain-containing protein n=1 Tax=Conoideocrella luteorostrata TaxID=1105319 RepID=A0AAJ0CQG8_9HYPO|nr:hypothetical protein QQS21_004922 [Conoideocrella luteorostrata]
MTSPKPGVAFPHVENETVHLHPNGDAVLVIQSDPGRRYLVSSKTLQLASDYFDVLFRPTFAEGKATQNGECPDIILKEDDPEAMAIILSILHHRFSESHWVIKPQLLAKVAQHSDKYQCNLSLQPWISYWVRNVQGLSGIEEFGLMLTAAYFFRIQQHFSEMSATVIRNIPIDFDAVWAEHDIIGYLPQFVKDELKTHIYSVIDDIRFEVESVEGSLRDAPGGFLMQRQYCLTCEGFHPANARQCYPGDNEDPYDEMCTNQGRIAEYFDILRRRHLWPTRSAFRYRSIAELVTAIGNMESETEKHKCAGGLSCPLITEIRLLYIKVKNRVENIKGIGSNPDEGESH